MLKNRTFSSPDAPGRYAYTGDFRAPKKGEFYLSGAIVSAYRAPNDLAQKFHIARLVSTGAKGQK
jgi:hypothetical protein